MIERIKLIQEEKVDELLELSNKSNLGKIFTLKAPTGSGKTYMQAYLISQLLKNNPGCIVIYQSPSKGSLTQQNSDAIVNYNFSNIKPYLLSSEKSEQEKIIIPLGDYNVYFLPRELNKASKTLLTTPLCDFLVYRTKKIKKFLIIDECHEAHKNIEKYFEQFEKIYGFSATPNSNQLVSGMYVELLDDFCVDEKLIKRKQNIDTDKLVFPENGNISEMENYVKEKLEKALEKFKEIKHDYESSGIKPALIIQISNSSNKTLQKNGEIQKNKIIQILNSKGILWYYRDQKGYESSDKIDELKGADRVKAWNYVKSDTSSIDVIIFKLAINVGVDIPRACYLLQIRQTKSDTLNEQVIGRIRRNPKLKDWDSLDKNIQDKLMIAYIDGVEKQETKPVKFVKRKQNIEILTTELISKVPNQLRNIEDLKLEKYDSSPQNIFKLKENWDKLDGNIKKELKHLTKNEWIKYCMNIEILNKTSFIPNYKDNIKISGKWGLPEETFYRKDSYIVDIEKWNWINRDSENDQEYAFEGEAERTIADELAKKRLKLWGKNFFHDSKISFEYFLKQKGNLLILKQHPDFYIIQDEKKYLLEVKSFYGKQNQSDIDKNDYEDKVESIKKAYKEIAQLTNQIMVLIVKNDHDSWTSFVYEKDKEEMNYYNNEKFDFLK